jgi:DNA invertase Pin-like site-specific DNA recombinase
MSKPRRLIATAKAKHAPSKQEVELAELAAKRAVLYLRVSTPSQVKTDYNPEGISLPAQRDACTLKTGALGADVVREFVEPGRTATSIEKRPVFQEMLAWIKAEKNIDYIIVYQFNRIFRNSIDAAISKKELSKYGTRIVSTAMDLGEGPESAMVETILHAVDEYRSKADGADIAYKMGAKARNGGTLGRAPLGYLNARDMSEGRNIGIVKLDPERAPLIKVAFELYASGDYSIEGLGDELTRRGLRTKPARFPSGPVSTSKLQELLRDPYYIGYVTYDGELIPGRHERLVSDELFDRTQAILDERGGPGERRRRHHHYLKGSLWCGLCHDEGVESRMIMQWATGRRGGRYRYFFCRRKQQHLCKGRYVEGDALEDAVVEFYGTLRFPTDMADNLRQVMRETLDEEERTCKLVHQQLSAQLARLDTQEENLLDLVANGGESSAKVKQRLNVIQRERSQVAQQLEQTGERLAIGAALIEDALKLLHDPQGLYEQMAPEQRRLMNQAIYAKLYVYEDTGIDAVFNPPFDELLEAKQALTSAKPDGFRATNRPGTLAAVLLDGGSNKRVMVEVTGFEPATSTMRTCAGARS